MKVFKPNGKAFVCGILMVIDGCSPDEVATELCMSRWAVSKARARVLQRLRDEFAGPRGIGISCVQCY